MDIFAQFAEMPPETRNAATAVAIAVGTLYCFLGYRALKVVLGLTGFVLAGGTAAVLAGYLSASNFVAMAVAGLMGGICGAMALFFLYKLGVFFVGLLGSLIIALHVLQGRPETWAAWAILGAALGGGLLAMLLERPVITLATATLGAWVTVAGIAYFAEGPEFIESLGASGVLSQEQLVAVGCWIILSIAGAIAQFATHKPKAETKEVIREVRVAE